MSMKLYLSSLSIPNEDAFLSLFGPGKNSVGLIANAWGPYPLEKRQPFIDGLTDKLKHMGFKVKPINLLDYTNRQDDLQKALRALQGVCVTGGNTFFLNWAVHQAGLQNIMHGLGRNGFVYYGESAGAVVAGTTLHGVEQLDSLSDAPHIIWEGMKLVDYGIVPHWNNPKYKTALQACKKEMSAYTTTKTITDTEFVIIG
jgi:dipeptidase E